MVGGETVLCMPPCNRLKKVGPSCRHGGCGRTTGGPPGHRLRVVDSSLGPDPSRGYGWIQFGVLVVFSIYL